MITLAVDCMGGDAGVRVTLPACKKFLDAHPDARLLMVGQAEALQSFQHERASIVPASEVVTKDDPVEVALRKKKDSSMRVAIAQVKDGAAQVAVSAGNTGALMAIARYLLNGQRITDESKDPVARDYRDALKMLGQLAAGKLSLGGTDPAAPATVSTTDVRCDAAPQVFGRSELRSFR